MKHWKIIPAALTGVSVLAITPLLAQEQDRSALNASLSVSQRFETGKNLALDVPDAGTTTLSTTALRFNLNSETRSQSLGFSLGGVLREGRVPSGSDISTGFADPQLSLSYGRSAANANFRFSTRFRQTDVSFIRPITDFMDEDGEIVLPEDFDERTDVGKRNDYSLSSSLEIGKDAPLGFVFSLGASGIHYTDGATQDDSRRANAGVSTRLRFSQVSTGRIDLRYNRYESDSAAQTERDTYALSFGLKNELAGGTVIDSEIGLTEIETTDTGGRETTSGLFGSLTLRRDLSNGSASAAISSSRDQAGERLTIRVSRSMDLQRGSLSASVGATSFDGGTPDLVGSLRWQQQLPRGAFSLRLNRTVSTNDEDEQRLATAAIANFSYDINSMSSLGASVNFGLTEGTASANRVEQTGLSVSYNRTLTRDWVLSTGVSYRSRDEDSVGLAESTSVFVSLNRSFDLLP